MQLQGIEAPNGLPPALGWRYGKAAVWNVNPRLQVNVTFLTNILIANLLGRNIFGRYSIIRTTIVMIVGIAQLATGITGPRYIAEIRFRDKERARANIGSLLDSFIFFRYRGNCSPCDKFRLACNEILKVPDIVKALLISSALVFQS